MKIYISGKISDLPIEQAQASFDKAEKHLMDKGLFQEVINPMKLDHSKSVEWSDYMRTDIVALMGCHAIYMLKGWETSRGAVIERDIAKKIFIHTFYEEGAAR